MGAFSKNLSKSLARQAIGAGGISQAQDKTNDGYEKVAGWLSKLLATGYALAVDQDPEDQELLDELTEGSEVWCEKVANVLLENDGAAVRGLLRIIINPTTF